MSLAATTMRMLALSLALGLCACAALAARPLPTTEVEVGGQRFKVEVAADDASRARGLMFRESMPLDHGMLFVFEHEQPLAFWMKNTRIPLDILYFDAGRRLVSVSADTPPCRTAYCPSYPSAGPARYVLELNAGKARELQLQPGALLRIEPIGGPSATLD